jgi:hypothetical protein
LGSSLYSLRANWGCPGMLVGTADHLCWRGLLQFVASPTWVRRQAAKVPLLHSISVSGFERNTYQTP